MKAARVLLYEAVVAIRAAGIHRHADSDECLLKAMHLLFRARVSEQAAIPGIGSARNTTPPTLASILPPVAAGMEMICHWHCALAATYCPSLHQPGPERCRAEVKLPGQGTCWEAFKASRTG